MSASHLIVGGHSKLAEKVGRLLAITEQLSEGAQAEEVVWHPASESLTEAVTKAFKSGRAFGTVVFDMPLLDEHALMKAGAHDELCAAVEQHALDFVAALQLTVAKLMAVSHAQIWVMVREQSFRYHLSVPGAPVLSQLRCSTVRTVAKEVARFGLRVNASVFQYGASELTDETWRHGRDGLKCYAQKYKPYDTADLANHLVTMIRNRSLPVNGAVMQIGCGVLEDNA